MAVLLKNFLNYYNYIFSEYKDPITIDYPIIDSPIPVAIIIVAYVYVVLSWGPKFMANRNSFDVTRIMIIYNLFQIIANLYMSITGVMIKIAHPEISLTCEPITYADTAWRRRILAYGYFYFMIKITDLLDTVFIVLRKRQNQISVLHVFHHTSTLFFTYLYVKFLTGSQGFLVAIINSFIHTIMYSYYLISMFKPEIKTSSWKKYITQMQMLQIFMYVIYFAAPQFVRGCTASQMISWVGIVQNTLLFALFANYYIKAYLKNKSKFKEV